MTFGDIGLLVLRLAIGATFAAHGAQKLLGWWNGPGLTGWRGVMAKMGFRPPMLWAVVSATAELAGGGLLAIGLLTPLMAALLVAQSVVIIVQVHWPKGFWNSGAGYEFPLQLAAGAVALIALGPGGLSIDRLIGFAPSDVLRVGLLVAGVLAGAGALLVPRLSLAAAAEPAPQGR